MELTLRDNAKIKFRAWDEINKIMVYEKSNKGFFESPSNGDFLNRYENIMQYSGLNDKTNKEIYEGDFVKDGNRILFVRFTNGAFNFFSKQGYMIKNLDTTWFEIIGNLFETPNCFTEQS